MAGKSLWHFWLEGPQHNEGQELAPEGREGTHRAPKGTTELAVGRPQEHLPLGPESRQTRAHCGAGRQSWPHPRAASGLRTIPPAMRLWCNTEGQKGSQNGAIPGQGHMGLLSAV